jgi:hypothetical protein
VLAPEHAPGGVDEDAVPVDGAGLRVAREPRREARERVGAEPVVAVEEDDRAAGRP